MVYCCAERAWTATAHAFPEQQSHAEAAARKGEWSTAVQQHARGSAWPSNGLS